MYVETAKVLAKLLLLLRTNVLEVLVTEDYNTTLGYQQGELVLLGVRELGQLQPGDFGADSGRQLGDLQAGVILGQKVRLCRIRVQPAVLEIKELGGRELGGGVVNREICSIFGLCNKLGRQ